MKNFLLVVQMPNFGFNPFAPRSNTQKIGIEQGDARRYYSRDVIRTSGEKVDINPIFTVGEARKKQKTQLDEKITELVQKEREFAVSGGTKLKFVSGETMQPSHSAFSGLMTCDEYSRVKKEERRRRELCLYQLPKVRCDIECEIV